MSEISRFSVSTVDVSSPTGSSFPDEPTPTASDFPGSRFSAMTAVTTGSSVYSRPTVCLESPSVNSGFSRAEYASTRFSGQSLGYIEETEFEKEEPENEDEEETDVERNLDEALGSLATLSHTTPPNYADEVTPPNYLGTASNSSNDAEEPENWIDEKKVKEKPRGLAYLAETLDRREIASARRHRKRSATSPTKEELFWTALKNVRVVGGGGGGGGGGMNRGPAGVEGQCVIC
ncbi:hypothetical protein YB2330_001976 [Saitoella coloradoensis]